MFQGWSNFFTMAGSAGATLLGLLFVVVTLGNNLPASRKLDIAHASMTPALYSFGGVLVQSMLVLVPWQTNWHSGIALGTLGLGGLVYRVNAVRVRNSLHLAALQRPVDRIFHNVFPVGASVVLIFGSVGLVEEWAIAPFAVALSSTLLLVSGIYRSWSQTLALIGLQE